MPILADFGTTWTKVLDTATGERRVLPTRESGDVRADLATGHNARRRAPRSVNELIALARGGLRLVKEPEFTLVDVGSRDVKYVRLREGDLVGMDWETTCGALTGFTLELLGRYYGLDYDQIEPAGIAAPVTCGVLGMERLFELVSEGASVEEAVARFVRGVALNAHRFAGEPGRIYLSGGMCDNRLFLRSFPPGVVVVPMGRFVLVEGLLERLERGFARHAEERAGGTQHGE